MRLTTLLFVLFTAATVYFVTSSSQKTSGRVDSYSDIELPELPADSELIDEDTSPETLQDLSLPQLLALDIETADFIRLATIDAPEETSEWALSIENEFARFKVLKHVLYTWADQSPKTCAFWVEQMPAYDKNLELFTTVAESWAANAPTSAMEEYRTKDKKNKPKYGKFVLALTKSILKVWAEKSPDLAASWVTQNIQNQNERKELHPVIMHAWFQKSSPSRLFSWLIQFKYDEEADLDSIYLMQEWVIKDSNAPFEWLSKQLNNDYIDELIEIATDTLADKDLKACEAHMNNPKYSSLRSSLVQAIIVKTSGKDDKKALTALSKLDDVNLISSICYKSAMQLVGKDDDALKYVKAAGFLTFPDLDEFFLKWTEGDSRKVLKWLKSTNYTEFSSDLFNYQLKKWNQDPYNPQIKVGTVELMNIYLKQHPDLQNKEIPIEALPGKFKEKYQKTISSWNDRRMEIISKCAALWASKNYEEALSFALADTSTVFTSVCLEGILPLAPEKSFDLSLKKLDQLKDTYPKKELYSYLALSKADKSPIQTFDLLRKRGLMDSNFVIEAIDRGITHKRVELNKVLERARTSNMHIYFPYYFYQLTRLDPKNSHKSLAKYHRKPWHNSALKAIASSFKDYHPNRLNGWVKSLNQKEKDIISPILQ